MSTPSDTPEIQPALTPEQWERVKQINPNELTVGDMAYVLAGDKHGEVDPGPPDHHALAALCLHDHPAGFTWEDVEMLRALADDYESLERHGGDERSTLLSVADRIAALLPPKKDTP